MKEIKIKVFMEKNFEIVYNFNTQETTITKRDLYLYSGSSEVIHLNNKALLSSLRALLNKIIYFIEQEGGKNAT